MIKLKILTCSTCVLRLSWLFLFVLLLQFSCHKILAENCNEIVCGSVVSKCLLTQSCQCKLSDCHCCKDCFNCLGHHFKECCACLDMCPQHNDTLSALAPKSQIGDFEGVPELFESLTAEDDEEQWTTKRFPMRTNLRNNYGDAIDRHASLEKIPPNVNCTVIYLNACTTNIKCSQYCESMGSNSYRWFHNGCCECIGANCFNYGINKSQCTACFDTDEEGGFDDADDEYGVDDDEDDMATWDYGEEEINYN